MILVQTRAKKKRRSCKSEAETKQRAIFQGACNQVPREPRDTYTRAHRTVRRVVLFPERSRPSLSISRGRGRQSYRILSSPSRTHRRKTRAHEIRVTACGGKRKEKKRAPTGEKERKKTSTRQLIHHVGVFIQGHGSEGARTTSSIAHTLSLFLPARQPRDINPPPVSTQPLLGGGRRRRSKTILCLFFSHLFTSVCSDRCSPQNRRRHRFAKRHHFPFPLTRPLLLLLLLLLLTRTFRNKNSSCNARKRRRRSPRRKSKRPKRRWRNETRKSGTCPASNPPPATAGEPIMARAAPLMAQKSHSRCSIFPALPLSRRRRHGRVHPRHRCIPLASLFRAAHWTWSHTRSHTWSHTWSYTRSYTRYTRSVTVVG